MTRTLFESGHYRQAVPAAATAINANTQAKLQRTDLSERKLIREAFTRNPRAGLARLEADTTGLSGETANGMQAAMNRFACVSSSELAPAVVVNSGATAWVRRHVEVDAGGAGGRSLINERLGEYRDTHR